MYLSYSHMLQMIIIYFDAVFVVCRTKQWKMFSDASGSDVYFVISVYVLLGVFIRRMGEPVRMG